MGRRFVILDRDGTIITERNYLGSPTGVELLPNAAAGLRAFQDRGFGLIVITNQSGVGRGYFDMETVGRVHARLLTLLEEEGVALDGIYVCPHEPSAGCSCRKPATGLIARASRELDFDASEAIVIGDKDCDVELGRRIGATTVLVLTGYGRRNMATARVSPDLVATDLYHAAILISRQDTPLISDAATRFRAHIHESIETKERLLAKCESEILKAAGAITSSLASGRKILLCGNGGSAADCQHIAAEFVSVLTQEYVRPGLPAIALTTDTSILTASANDFGFEGIFERQVQAVGQPGDVLIGITTSGNSVNVVRAVQYAAKRGIRTIALTGGSGGAIAAIAQTVICVPSLVTMHIQEAHIAVGHILCYLAERSLGATAQGGSDTVAHALYTPNVSISL